MDWGEGARSQGAVEEQREELCNPLKWTNLMVSLWRSLTTDGLYSSLLGLVVWEGGSVNM